MKKIFLLYIFLNTLWLWGQNQIASYEYWIDNDYTSKVTVTMSPQQTININEILNYNSQIDGLHSFNIRFKDNTSLWSSISSNFFYKIPSDTTTNRTLTTYEYWIDNDYTSKVTVTMSPQQTININEILNYNSQIDGLHSFNIRFKDNTSLWSSISSNFFYKIPSDATTNRTLTTYEYWIDNDYTSKVTVTMSPQQTININEILNYNSQIDGLHSFNIRFKDNTSLWSSISSNFFYKTNTETIILRNIIAYEYWYNDNYSNKVNVAITPNQTANINTFIIPQNLGLGIGTHQLNIRFKDDTNQWSSISTDTFDLTTLSISDNNLLKNIVLYPNPTDGYLNIDLKQVYTEIDIKVFDVRGIEVYNQNNQNTDKTEIHLGFASGMYFVNITADGKSCTHKIIKK